MTARRWSRRGLVGSVFGGAAATTNRWLGLRPDNTNLMAADKHDRAAPPIEELELPEARRAPLELPAPVTALAWSEALQLLAVAYDWGRKVRIFDAAGKMRREIHGAWSNLSNSMLFLDDRRVLVTAAMDEPSATTDAALSLWDIESGRVLKHIAGPFPGSNWQRNRARAFAGSADGVLLGAESGANLNNGAVLYNVREDKQLARLLTQNVTSAHDIIASIDVPPAGRSVALGMVSGKVVVLSGGKFERATRSFVAFPVGATTGVNACKFDPTGSLIAAGAGLTMEDSRAISGRPRDSSAAYPDGQLPSVEVWNLQNGKLEWSLADRLAPIRQFAWTQSAHSLVFAAGDGTVRIWDRAAMPRARLFTGRLGTASYTIAVMDREKTLAASAGQEVRFFTING